LIVPDSLSRKLQPGLEGNLVVHIYQEWIHLVLLLYYLVLDLVVGDALLTLLLALESFYVDLELGTKLEDLHLLVDLHVTVLSSHASVKKLVEIDEGIVTLDTHLQDLLLQLLVINKILIKSKVSLLLTQLSEEVTELGLLHLDAPVLLLGQIFPDIHELLQVILEEGDHVLFGQVVLLELLDDNQDEQVKHDMGACHHKGDEVYFRVD